ncbi:hypothetical protein [Massilia sp. S19_KUP03_FR1]|uniref:hypothetical protein n=1 Tax=Massilia sp. S19_KUP03_FR1 TaxID=3025503 RepID=UPI002FCDD5DE
MNKRGILLALLLALSGCSSGSGDPDTTATPAPTAPVDAGLSVFHGITVPPDPGSAADTTIAGVDTDRNGIRDEVDRYNAQTYGADPVKYSGAQLAAKTKQNLLVTSITDINAATAAVYAEADSGACLVDKFPSDNVTAIHINDDMVLRTFNTQQRQQQIKSLMFKVGQFTRSSQGVVCK